MIHFLFFCLLKNYILCTQLQIPCTQAQLKSQTQTQSQTQPESQIPDLYDSPTDETLPKVVQVFREMFQGSTTPPDSFFCLSPKIEGVLIPKGEEDEPMEVCNIKIFGFFFTDMYLQFESELQTESESQTESTFSHTPEGTCQLASRILKELKALDSLRIKKRQLYWKMLTLSHQCH